MRRALEAWSVHLAMYARDVEDASIRLRELRQDERQDLVLAALALGLALAATEFRPVFAMPLYLGAVVIGIRGVNALWRRWELVDRLAGERDAYVIPEVLAYAAREATMERRHSHAVLIRSRLREPGVAIEARIQAAAPDLEALATGLEDEEFELDPACAVSCTRLLSDLEGSPLLNPALPPEELRSRVHQILSGFQDPRPATNA